ncbi:MAG TPA: toll/interleukin-1 receptor domain-containing protein [Phycisphaerae bacterium]|nr:toll/interleukin-1 receptor domain-containing protein [Phycisphaerae bacterium]
MAFSVFISYSTNDLANAKALSSWVKAAGAQPFLAEYSLSPGQPLASGILAAIRNCNLFLLLWTGNARNSEWVPQEIGIAKGAGKDILPIVLQRGLTLPGFIKDLKYLAVYNDQTATIQWLYQHLTGKVKQKEEIEKVVAGGIVGAILLLLAVASKS